MDRVRVELVRKVDESYDVIVGQNLFPQIAKDLKERGKKIGLVTDDRVWPLHGERLLGILKDSGLDASEFVLKSGEANKTRENWEPVEYNMLDKGFRRDSIVVALGGGMVGDVAGWIAGTLNRGIDLIQVPTTLLAQADSSVGGKTGYDTPHGKNLIGVFKQPLRVYSDVDTLGTLSPREFRQGLAETVKHGVILDSEFFSYLSKYREGILDRVSTHLIHLGVENARIKASVVMADPDEKGLRRILNYGHTIGHAVEKVSGFELMHGEAVSIGMMVEARISCLMGLMPLRDVMNQESLLRSFGLPVDLPQDYTDAQILEVAGFDKKNAGGKTRYTLPLSIGAMNEFSGQYATAVERKIVENALLMSRK